MKDTAPPAQLDRLFPGSSEMARLLRTVDWTRTPLGPVENWSPTLRTMIGFLLANRFPLLLWWGPEYVQIYNDAYIPVPGKKHPQSVGQRARECWSEIWNVIGPLIDTPFLGGPPTWMEDLELEVHRHGFTEETHFTVAYSPVPDSTAPGGIGGVLATVHETTQQVIQQRRARILRDLSAAALETRTTESACISAADVLNHHQKDVPLAAIYLLDDAQEAAKLVAGAGLAKYSGYVPSLLTRESDDRWALSELLQIDQPILIGDLPGQFSQSPPDWSDALPQQVIVLPIRSHLAHRPLGVVFFGINPKIAIDDLYRSFFELAAAQVATAIANARAYEEERQRAEALAAIDRAKTTFFSNVSHEFRTPLTLILGPLEETLRVARTQPASASRDRLELMWRNALRLQKLVNTLLDFSRIEAGRIEASYEPTDFSGLTAQLAAMFESAVERAGLRLVIDCPAGSQPAYLDREMWEKVVMNLLSNAVKFTLQGEIQVCTRETNDGFELTVRDTGVGIPTEEIPRLFERFHRVRDARSRTHEGTGIGLALVQELVRLHGGRIEVHSELDRGTEFKLHIPAGSAHLPPDRISTTRSFTSSVPGASPYVEEALRWLPEETSRQVRPLLIDEPALANAIETVPCRGARVLVADDNADMRDYLRGLLGQYWNVETVADGRIALQWIEANQPELVISDVMMPGLGGFELLRAVRSRESTKDLPIILLSARAGQEAAVEALKAGADVYLVKPFAARELIAYVASHLQLQRVRQQSLTVLRASEEKFSAAFDQSPLALTISSLEDGRLVEVNETFVRLTGYSRAEALGQTIDALKLWVEPEQRKGGLQQLRAGRWLTGITARFRTKSGGQITCLVGSRVIQINGRPHVLTSVSDVSDMVRAEATIAADLEAMTSLHRIGMICSRGELPVSACLEEILAAAIELTGAAKGNIQLRDETSSELRMAVQRGFEEPFLSFFARLDDNDRSACATALRSGHRVIAEDITSSELFAGTPSEAVLLAANVRAVQSTPLLSSSGNVLGVLSTHYTTPHRTDDRQLRLIDLLAREAAEYLQRIQAEEALHERAEQLTSLNSALRDADRRKDEFLAMLGHELRNPLSSVRNAVAIASLDEARRGRALEIARRQTEQLGRLIDDLLDVARVTQGRISLRKQRLSLTDVIRRAVESTQPFIDERGVGLEVRPSPQPMLLDADPARLEQVFVNLLTNAGKYTDAGGQIIIATERDDAMAVVRIRDNGVGISAELLPRIWDLFAQANRFLDRSEGGLGIGLTITRRLVELHGGSVEAQSKGPGKGAEFIVRLPLPKPEVSEKADLIPNHPTNRSARVLVVEDNVDAAESMTMLLEFLGHRVRAVGDGYAAVAAARSEAPDVMLVDIGLPGIDGYEVARRIRRESGLKHVGLIALTGYGREEDKQNAIAAGFDCHLVKPVNPEMLNGLLARFVTRGVPEERSTAH